MRHPCSDRKARRCPTIGRAPEYRALMLNTALLKLYRTHPLVTEEVPA